MRPIKRRNSKRNFKRRQKGLNNKPAQKPVITKTAEMLLQNLEEVYSQSVKFEKDSFRRLIHAGEIAYKIKGEIKHGDFMNVISEKIPAINIRDLQRAMKLSLSYDFSTHDHLFKVHRSHLEEIVKKAGDTDIKDFLEENGVNLDFDPDQEKELQNFLEKMKNLGKKQTNSKKENKKNPQESDIKKVKSESKQQPSEISHSAYLDYIKNLTVKRGKTQKKLLVRQVYILKKLVKALNRYIKDFGPQEDANTDQDHESQGNSKK